MDRDSLNDLDILGTKERFTLISMIDFTLTKGGRLSLLERARQPFNRKEDIISTQKILGNLLNKIDYWEQRFSDRQLDLLERYLRSNIVSPFEDRSRITRIWYLYTFKARYKSDWYFISTAIEQVCFFLKNFKELIDYIVLAGEENSEIKLAKEAIAKVFESREDLSIRILDAGKLSMKDIAYLDYFLRVKKKDECLKILKAFYKMDALFSLAKAHLTHNLRFPIISYKAGLKFNDLYHPFFPEGQANSVWLDTKTHIMLLTGPNMSGKSTFLKAMGLAVYMAHLGIGVCAASANIPLMDDIFTDINIADDIENGVSYFMAEIRRIEDLAQQLRRGKRLFVLVDELFRGTNPEEAVICSSLVIKELLKNSNSYFIITSHLNKLVSGMMVEDRIKIFHFDVIVNDKEILYDYKLRKGLTYSDKVGHILLERSTALKLLRGE